jgi:hypothetical protein
MNRDRRIDIAEFINLLEAIASATNSSVLLDFIKFHKRN